MVSAAGRQSCVSSDTPKSSLPDECCGRPACGQNVDLAGGFHTKKSAQLGNRLQQALGNHATDHVAAFRVQVRAIDLPFVIAWAEIRPHVVAGILGIRQGDCVKVDERHAFQPRERGPRPHTPSASF